MRRHPVIIGGGPAGCAAAITLARAGHAPILLERTEAPAHKVCGDFLGADTIALLQTLGCDPAAFGAEPIGQVRLFRGTGQAEANLPFRALSLSRRALDAALLDAARDAGAELRLGRAVRRITGEPGNWTVMNDCSASAVFLATGKHDLHGFPRPRASTAVGLKQYLRLPAAAWRALNGATEMILFPGGYAGLQPVEDGQAALCIAVRRTDFQRIGGTWDGLLDAIGAASPHLRDRLRDAEPVLSRPLTVAGVPYGYLRRDAADGLFRLGDQAAVIPSLTGDGMAIALSSGIAAAQAWLDGQDAGAFQRGFHARLQWQFRLGSALHRLFLQAGAQAATVRIAGAFPGLVRAGARFTRLPA